MERLGGGCQVAFAVNYTPLSRSGYITRIAGMRSRTIPFQYASEKPNEIADQLIRQLELGDA